MNYERLEQNLIDICLENQAKLGYEREKMRLYFPLSSLNHLLGTKLDEQKMQETLEAFCAQEKDRLGGMQSSHSGERFCICLMEDSCETVHLKAPKQSLIQEIVALVKTHTATIADIKNLFERFSDAVVFERISEEDFDYLLYFENGLPDAYYYCLKEEGHHITYHRFIKEDYLDLFGA